MPGFSEKPGMSSASASGARWFLWLLPSRDSLPFPHAQLLRRRRLVPLQAADEAEVQLAPLEVHAEDLHANQVAEAIAVVCLVAGERVGAAVVAVVVVFERS